MTYDETVRWLYSLTRIGMKPGLEATRRLASLAGNLQDHLRFIHVAGTNGKGSVCAFLESLCRRAGFRVGLYTSPHLVSFRERIQIDREPIGEAEVARLLEHLRVLAEADGLRPTFFEYVTVLALMFFAERHCDLVVLETGMGGRLDSTNIVTPLVSVITRIGIDHTAYLGDTLEAIAGEKAGIIKPRVPVVSATQSPSAAEVIRLRAVELGAPLIWSDPPTVAPKGSVQETKNSFFPELTPSVVTGEYRRRNAAVAVTAARLLEEVGVLPRREDAELAEALRATEWPGRLQVLRRGKRTWLLDGAHNEDGLRALVEALPELAADEDRTLILGMLADKEAGDAVALLAQAFKRILLTPVKSIRGGDPSNLAERIRRAGRPVELFPDLASAMAAVETGFVAIAGSFYLIGEALERLEATPAGLRPERELNEIGR